MQFKETLIAEYKNIVHYYNTYLLYLSIVNTVSICHEIEFDYSYTRRAAQKFVRHHSTQWRNKNYLIDFLRLLLLAWEIWFEPGKIMLHYDKWTRA